MAGLLFKRRAAAFVTRRRTYATFGDSIMGQQSSTDPANYGSPGVAPNNASAGSFSRGFVERALMRLNQPLAPLGNFGIGGNTTTQMLARIGTVLAVRPGYVFMNGGTNDNGGGISATTSIANLTAMLQIFRNAGIVVIDTTITPRTTGVSQALIKQIADINNFRQDWAAKNDGYYLCDLAAYGIDTSSVANSYGTPASGLLLDGLHPGAVGAGVFGDVALYNLLAKILPPTPRRCFFNGDATTNGDLNILNANPLLLQGTGGTAGAGTTGTVAQNYSVARSSGAIAAACSIVSRTSLAATYPTVFGDGRPGFAQQIALSGATALSDQVQFFTGTRSVTALSGPWVGECEFGATATSGTIIDLNLSVFVNATPTTFLCGANQYPGSSDFMNIGELHGVLRTWPFYMPLGASTAQGFVNMRTSVGGAATVNLANFSIRQLKV